MRPLTQEEKRMLSTKLAAMKAAVERKATTRQLRAVQAVKAAHPACDDVTRVDHVGRYSMVAS